jgi:hypothetical protein
MTFSIVVAVVATLGAALITAAEPRMRALVERSSRPQR